MAKILVMDDEEMIRDVMTDLIECLEHNCTTSVCGEEAIELYKKSFEANDKFDLVILDYNVKNGMGATNTAEELLKIDENALLVISSGDTELDEMRNFKKYGFCDYLKKPCKLNDVIDLLKKQNIN